MRGANADEYLGRATSPGFYRLYSLGALTFEGFELLPRLKSTNRVFAGCNVSCLLPPAELIVES